MSLKTSEKTIVPEATVQYWNLLLLHLPTHRIVCLSRIIFSFCFYTVFFFLFSRRLETSCLLCCLGLKAKLKAVLS